jgi:hypothetical protein
MLRELIVRELTFAYLKSLPRAVKAWYVKFYSKKT